MKKTLTSTKPTAPLKRPSVVTGGNQTHAPPRSGPSSIPVKAGAPVPRQPEVSTAPAEIGVSNAVDRAVKETQTQ